MNVTYIDAGLICNADPNERGTSFVPGDLMQAHLSINGVEIWLEARRPLNRYQVEFGSCPLYGRELLTKEQALAKLRNRLGEQKALALLELKGLEN